MFNKIIEMCLGTREKRLIILWAVIILTVAILALMVFNAMFMGDSGNFNRLANWSDFSKYQAVFLANGQVYFGKLAEVNAQTLVLEDIYYLRSAKNPQLPEERAAISTATDNFSLIKLGNEIHGPEDKMSINLSQVLFVEDLKSDSKVVEAIRAYESKK